MSGRNSLALLLLVALCGAPLCAQFLPGVKQFEVENPRLILLDKDGNRKGVLKGELARKQDDGQIMVRKAELTIERDEDAFVIKSDEFVYEPASHNFHVPKGLSADLPDGGKLMIPAGEGELYYTDGVLLKLTVQGDATLRSGQEGEELVNATITDPAIEIKLVEITKQQASKEQSGFALDHFTITGARGGDLKLRLDHLPDFGNRDKESEAVVNVNCFGDVGLSVTDGGKKADLHMLRRARMALDSKDGNFEVSSNQLDIRGDIVRKKADKKKPEPGERKASETTALTGIAIDAYQNVTMKGDEFDGTAAMLRYREFGDRRDVRLEGDPSLSLRQDPTPEGEQPRIEMRAKTYIEVQIPQGITGGSPAQISTELFDSAHVRRFIDDRVEWQINGRLVRLYSILDESTGRQGSYNHTFDAFAEGFTPLLRITGLQTEGENTPEIQRAVVYGARAEGSFIAGRAKVRVYGPDVLGVVHSNAPLSDLLRTGLGLQAPQRNADGEIIPPPPHDGRLTVRAARLLDLDLLTTGGQGDISLVAQGNVELDHQPLPRDDRNLVTLTGKFAALGIHEGSVRYARLDAPDNGDALATIGFDLLICRGIRVDEGAEGLVTDIAGPGRIVVRNEESVAYFRRELDRLPKRPDESANPPKPDAAWLNFGASFRSQIGDLARQLEADAPEFRLVFGGFEVPRAGRSSIKDLDELVQPAVQQLYEVHGTRVFASNKRENRGAPAVNVLMLEGAAYIYSRFDGITARAGNAIELSGSDKQSTADAPLSVVLRGNAQLEIEDAGVFFGDYVRGGVFAYDGRWLLESADRLEITFRPLEPPGDDATLIPQIREALGKAQQNRRAMLSRLQEVELAAQLLEQATTGKRPSAPGADQPWKALDEAHDASRQMRLAMHMYVAGHASAQAQLVAAMRSVRRARALLSALIDVAGSGNVQGHFRSAKTTVPPLDLAMRQALFTFDGLGQIVDVSAQGPIQVSRAAYTIEGKNLKRESNGTLTLDGAVITLPADTGVYVSGVETISLRLREGKTSDTAATERTMVTRVSGKKLRVSVKLGGD